MTRTRRALYASVALASLALAVAPARAQDAVIPGAEYASATPTADPFNTNNRADGLRGSQLPDDTLGNALMFDPSSFVAKTPAKPLRTPRLSDADKGLDMNRVDKPDGSSAYSFKQPVFTDWDAKVGADLNDAGSQPVKPILGPQTNADTGAAWANVGIPNLGSIDARVAPSQEQGKVGATLQRAVPVGRDLSVTLQNTISVTDTFGATPGTTLAPALPTSSLPAAPRVWGNEKTVKFDVLPTGTTFAAGVASATNDPATHNKFSAEQKVYGPLHVTTAVTDIGQTTSSKSITAGFKLNW